MDQGTNRGTGRAREPARAGRRTIGLPGRRPPDGYKQVFAGSTDANWSLLGNIFPVGGYYVRYQDRGGDIVQLAGSQLTAEQFDSFRFFAFPIPHVRLGEHDALVGSVWSKDRGPYVATWRDPDGVTVRIFNTLGSRDVVRAVAEQSRALDRSEWVKLVEAAEHCKQEIP